MRVIIRKHTQFIMRNTSSANPAHFIRFPGLPRLVPALLSCALALAFGYAHSARAGDGTWNQTTAGNRPWTTTTYWASGTVAGSASPSTTDTGTATFNTVLAGTENVQVDTGRNIKNVTVGTLSGSAANVRYNFNTGTSFVLSAGGTILENGTAQHYDIFAVPITLMGAYTFDTSTATTPYLGLNFSSTITGTATTGTTNVLTLQGSSTAYIGVNANFNAIVGVIADGSGGGALSVIKNGSGYWALTGANTYSGGTTINAGRLYLGSSGRLGSTSGALTISGTSLLDLGAHTLTNGAVSITGAATIQNGTLTASSYSATLTSGTATISAILAGSSAALTKTGAGTLALSGANTYSGGTTVSAGVLSAQNSSSALGAGSASVTGGAALQVSGNANLANALTLNGTGIASGGALRNLADANTCSGAITLGSASRINSDAGTLTLSSGTAISGATFGLTLGGSGNLSISSAISTTTGTLTKEGTGTLTLSGANTYTGNTTVSAGELKFSTAGSATTAVTVDGGATNAVLVATAGGQWVNTGSLTHNSSSILHIDYGSTTPSQTTAPMKVASLSLGASLTLQIDGVGLVGGSKLPLITWTGSGPADATAFTTLILPTDVAGTLSVSASTLYFTVAASRQPLTWNNGDGSWDTTCATNWVDVTLAAATYIDGADSVVFDDASGATGNPSITLDSVLSPVKVTMKSTNHNYAISGTGGIGGSTALTLDAANTRTLTLAADNSYTGGTTNNAGILVADSNTALGTGLVTMKGGMLSNNVSATLANDISLSANSTIAVASAATLTLGGVITNSGRLTVAGPGILTLSGANTYTNATAVNAGTLCLNGSIGALSSYRSSTAIAGGAVFNTDVTGVGGVYLGTGGSTTAALGASASYTVSGAGTWRITGGSSDILGLGCKSGGGKVAISLGAGGLIDIQGGVLVNGGWQGAYWTNNLASLNIASGAVFDIWDGNAVTVDALTGSGTVNKGHGISATINLTAGANNGSGVFGGIFTNSSGAGAISLTKVGTGTQTLTGDNTYTGGTTISNGVLEADSNTALGAGPVTLNGGTLSNNVSATLANAVNLSAAGAIGVGSGQTFTLGGLISGGGTLTKTGAGTLKLGASGSIVSTNIIDNGTFDVSAVTSGYHLVTGKTLSGTGTVAGPMTVDNGATLTVGGSLGTTVGTLTVNGGLTLNGATTLRLNKGGGTTSDQITWSSGTVAFGGTLNLSSVGATLASGDSFTIFQSGGTGFFSAISPATPGSGLIWDTSSLNASGVVKVVTLAGTITAPATLSAAITGVFGVASPSSSVSISGSGLTGSVTAAATTGLEVSSDGSTFGSTATFTETSGTMNGTLYVRFGPAVAVGTYNSQTVVSLSGGGAAAVTVATTASGNTVSNETWISTATSGTWGTATNWLLNTVANGAGVTADFSQVDITSDTTVSLDNSYTIENLIFGNTDVSPNAHWFLDNGGSSGNTLTLAGTTPTVTVNNLGTSKAATISAEVAGTSGLTKVGPGTLNLSSAASTYSGGTTVSAGVLGAQASSALGGGSVSVTGGAALQVDGDGLNLANALTLNGTGISSGGALRNLANTNTCSGAITLGSASRINSDAGTLTLNSGTAISGATLGLTLGGSGSLSVFDAISTTTGTLTKDGTGTVSLSGANTYTGTTTVSSGELDLANWGGTTLGTVTVGNTAGVTATLGITGGTFPMGGVAFFVGTGGAVGIVNQSGGTVSFTTQNLDLLIGNGGVASGTYNLSGGTLSASFSSTARGVMLGVNSGASATFSLSGTGVLSLPGAELAVGRDDAGQTGCTAVYSQSGGSATVGYLSIGGQSGSTTTTATFSITDGTFVATNFQHLVAAASSSATLTLGGSAQVILPAFPVPVGTANLTFDFTSGSLSPYAASTTYLQGLTHAYLTTNGANFNVGSGNDITVAQVLHDATAGGTLTKSGAGTLTLSGANTYTGNTTVNGGTLEIVQPTLAANSTVTVASSAVLQLDFAVTNTVAALVLNSVSQPAGVYDSISGAPYLTGMGSLLVSSGIATNPTNIVASVAGNQLTLSWPADHTGWQLQSNSVSVVDSNAWFLVPGSTTTNQVILTIDPAQSNVFFRMEYTP